MNPLLDELRAAFPPSPLDATGAFAWESDAGLFERAVHGKTWDEVDPRVIARSSDALAFLSLERFVAWLPTYLHFLLIDPCSSVASLLMMTLTPRKRRRFEQLAAQLTPAQRRTVVRTLQLVIERHPVWGEQPRDALDRYWGAFAESPTVTQDPLLQELRSAFPPVALEDVFVEDDWQYCELYEYRRAVEGKTGADRPSVSRAPRRGAGAARTAVVCAVLPMHLHLLIVYAPTAATEHVITALDRDDLALSDAQRAVIARYRAAIS